VLVILNFNSSESTIRTYESFLAENSIIIDNNSTEEERIKIIKYCKKEKFLIIEENNISYFFSKKNFYFQKILILLKKNYGYAKGNNYGLKMSKKIGFRYAFVANNDTLKISDNVFSKLISVLESNKDALAIGPKVINKDGSIIVPENFVEITLFNVFWNYFLYPAAFIRRKVRRFLFNPSLSKIAQYYSLSGCFICFDIEKFSKIGFFDEGTFLYGEENIVGYLAKKNKYKMLYDSDVKIYHDHGLTADKFFSKMERLKIRMNSEMYYGKKYRNWGKTSILIYKISFYCRFLIWGPIIEFFKKISSL
jgi:GT2 family glycosyltransferase